jgi:hypothetical protein
MSETLELRRWRHFGSRLAYLRSYMAPGEATLLDYLLHGAMTEQWAPHDAAIDRYLAECATER